MTSGLLYKDEIKKFWLEYRYFLLAIAVFTIAMLYRRYDAFDNPQFWAEDGVIFFMEQDQNSSFIPFKHYNAYYHLIPRTISYLVKLVNIPLEQVPAAYLAGTYFIYILIFGLMWVFLPFHSITKFLMIICTGLLPIAPEVYLNLTNVQWFSALIIILLLFDLKERSAGWTNLLTMAVIFSGLTGPFSMMFVPLLLLKLRANRKSPKKMIPVFAALMTGIIQFIALYNHFQGRLFIGVPVPKDHFLIMLYNTVKQVFLFDHRLILPFQAKHWILVAPLLILYLSGFIWSMKSKNRTGVLLLVCIALSVFFTVKANWPYEWLISPFLGGMRYFFIPFTLVVWYLLIHFKDVKLLQGITAALCLAVFLVHGKWTRATYVDYQWKKEIKEYKEIGEVVVPINPPGWFLTLKPKK